MVLEGQNQAKTASNPWFEVLPAFIKTFNKLQFSKKRKATRVIPVAFQPPEELLEYICGYTPSSLVYSIAPKSRIRFRIRIDLRKNL